MRWSSSTTAPPTATADRAHAAGAVVVRHPFNLGQGAALQTGIEYALTKRREFVVTFDADGQHRVADITASDRGVGPGTRRFRARQPVSRTAPNLPPLRRMLLQAATLFTRLTTGLQVTDTHNGLRAMTRRGAARAQASAKSDGARLGMPHQIGSSGLRYVEQPVTIEYTAYSLAKGQNLARCACSSCSICLRGGSIDDCAIDPVGVVGGILLYAWTEYRRSPAVAFLTVAIASSGSTSSGCPSKARNLRNWSGSAAASTSFSMSGSASAWSFCSTCI